MPASTPQGSKENFQLSFRFLPELSGFQSIFRCIFRCRAITALLFLALSLGALFASVFLLPPGHSLPGLWLFNTLILTTFSILMITFYLIWVDLLKPILNIEIWSQQMRKGYRRATDTAYSTHRTENSVTEYSL